MREMEMEMMAISLYNSCLISPVCLRFDASNLSLNREFEHKLNFRKSRG